MQQVSWNLMVLCCLFLGKSVDDLAWRPPFLRSLEDLRGKPLRIHRNVNLKTWASGWCSELSLRIQILLRGKGWKTVEILFQGWDFRTLNPRDREGSGFLGWYHQWFVLLILMTEKRFSSFRVSRRVDIYLYLCYWKGISHCAREHTLKTNQPSADWQVTCVESLFEWYIDTDKILPKTKKCAFKKCWRRKTITLLPFFMVPFLMSTFACFFDTLHLWSAMWRRNTTPCCRRQVSGEVQDLRMLGRIHRWWTETKLGHVQGFWW